ATPTYPLSPFLYEITFGLCFYDQLLYWHVLTGSLGLLLIQFSTLKIKKQLCLSTNSKRYRLMPGRNLILLPIRGHCPFITPLPMSSIPLNMAIISSG